MAGATADRAPRRASHSGGVADPDDAAPVAAGRSRGTARDRNPEELPERIFEGKPKSAEAAEKALVRRPQIGDSRPAPDSEGGDAVAEPAEPAKTPAKRRRGGRGRGGGGGQAGGQGNGGNGAAAKTGGRGEAAKGEGRGEGDANRVKGGGGRGAKRAAPKPVTAIIGGIGADASTSTTPVPSGAASARAVPSAATS